MTKIGPAVLSIGAALMLVGSFGPWVSVLGAVDLVEITANSWDLRDLAIGLGFAEGSAFEIAAQLYIIVPVLLIAAVIASWSGHRVVAQVLGTIGGLYGGAVAFAVTRAPEIRLYTLEWGVAVSIVGSVVMLVGVGVELVNSVRARHRV